MKTIIINLNKLILTLLITLSILSIPNQTQAITIPITSDTIDIQPLTTQYQLFTCIDSYKDTNTNYYINILENKQHETYAVYSNKLTLNNIYKCEVDYKQTTDIYDDAIINILD